MIVFDQSDHARVAGEASRSLGSNGRAVLDLAAAGFLVLQSFGCNVNHDLVLVATRHGFSTVCQEALGHDDQSIGSFHPRRQFRKIVRFRGTFSFCFAAAVPIVGNGFIKRFHGSLQCFQDQSTGLGRQASLQDQRAVIIERIAEISIGLLLTSRDSSSASLARRK